VRVSLFLDHACNLRCTYCYNGRAFRRTMPWEVAERGIALALDGPGPRRVSFFGGEPLLRWDLVVRCLDHAAVEAARRGVAVEHVIVTNGTLLDGHRLEALLCREVFVAVSVDGDATAHDAARRTARGGPTWARVARNVRPLLAARPGSKVIAVVHPGNVDRLAESFEALLDLGARNLSMNLDYGADWDEAARDRFVAALARLGERYVEAYRAGRIFSLNLLDSKIVTWVKGGFSSADRCDFGCLEVAVSPTGRLYPCDRLVGRDDREDVVIGDVWRGVDAARRDALVAAKNAVLAGCEGCALLPRCMHWCGCVNHAMTGQVGEVSGLLCWFEQRIVEEADHAATVLDAEDNVTFHRRFYLPRLVRSGTGRQVPGR